MELNKCVYLVFLLIVTFSSTVLTQEDTLTGNLKILKRVYENCERSDNLLKCLKLQALKFTDRALQLNSVNLIDGISLVRDDNQVVTSGEKRSFQHITKNGGDLKKLKSNEIDNLLIDHVQHFISTHKVQLSLPRLLAEEEGSGNGEARGDKLKKHSGMILMLLAMKAVIFAMFVKSVGFLAAKALLVGKIALVLSTILGLKKLLSGEGHEKTTYEIVKHPHVTHSNSYSSSHYGGGGEYESGVGHYHGRDLQHPYNEQDRAYKGWVPKTFH